jgi:hypothetical protein
MWRISRSKWLVMLTAAWLMAAGVVGWALAGHRKPRLRVIQHPAPSLTVRASSPAPGVIVVSAEARITHAFRDPVLWYAVDVRQVGKDADDWRSVWTHDYDAPAELVQARRGVEARPALAERRIAVAPGLYSVLVSVKEDAGVLTADGLPAETSHGMIGDSAWVEVK